MSVKEQFDSYIRFAIEQERLASVLYAQNAKRVQSRSAKLLFEELAAAERGHELKLQALLATGMASMPEPGEIRDLKIGDYMVQSELREDSPLDEIFIYAIKAEQSANQLYADLATLETSSAARELLLTLAEEELRHKWDLEDQYERVFMKDN